MSDYHYDGIVKPGETLKVIFYFQAVKPEEFYAYIDIYASDVRSAAPDIVISIAP
jgi:hypothetical protein